MDNNTLQQIKDLIAGSTNIGIAIGSNPTMDEMAGALSLYLLLKNANKNVSIASPSDPLVEVSSLVGIDKVQKSLGGGGDGDLTVSFPYTEGEIEKVSYTLEDGFLNIIVKAAEQGLSFNEKDVQYVRGGGSVELLFVVGTARLADIGNVVDTQNPDMRIINIDNKEENEQFGDMVLVSPRLSSISEGIADLSLSLGLHIDEDSAQNLLNGITAATSNFQDSKTSSLAFEMAALLIKKGATREVSQSARQGIRFDAQQPQARDSRLQRPQNQNQPQRRNDQRDLRRPQNQNRPDNRPTAQKQDYKSFEEDLQKRVQEEKDREAGRTNQSPRNPQQQQNSRPQKQDEEPVEDKAPNDWLTPKVYKGSSDV